MVWAGDCTRVKAIGAELCSGSIRIEGNAGMHLGREMSGGRIEVQGDVADLVATGMGGGEIHITGNAGDLVGAAWPGSKQGARAILHALYAQSIHGWCDHRKSGKRKGDHRRSWLRDRHGAGMRRGTIAAMDASTQPELLPTFKFSCLHKPVWLSFFLRELKSVGFPVPEDCLDAEYRRYCGDFLTLGKGEVLVRQ